MHSLTARLLLAASAVLIAFLGLTGLALDQAFRDSALNAVRDRLQAQVYMLLGAAEVDDEQNLTLPRALPEVRLLIPDSGLFALVQDNRGRTVWRSESMLGVRLQTLPDAPRPGDNVFEQHATQDQRGLLLFGFSISWELDPDNYRGYTFWVAESERYLADQVASFRRSLWFWLLGAALLLLAVQVLVLRWTLHPLRKVAHEVREIEAGHREMLSGDYPSELQALTASLNSLVREGRNRLERSRHALADLAHSLKTPLAVLNSASREPLPDGELRETVHQQLERMNQTVDYQLHRAAASGRIALTATVDVGDSLRKVRESLLKVYADKRLRFEVAVDPDARFQGDRGDLLEILGNLADNACKWASQQVGVAVRTAGARLIIEITDDGPGIPEDQRERILDRGQRADPDTPGHGIGLAVVRDLVEDVYQGRLWIAASDAGGARVTVELPGRNSV